MRPFTIVSPAGNAGLISQVATFPPELAAEISEIVTLRVNT